VISRDSSLFDFKPNDVAPVLLILDRREDSITPLLNQVFNFLFFVKLNKKFTYL
jgi:hypothetical protein